MSKKQEHTDAPVRRTGRKIQLSTALRLALVVAAIVTWALVYSGCDSEFTHGFGTIDSEKEAEEYEQKQQQGASNTEAPLATDAPPATDEPVTIFEPDTDEKTSTVSGNTAVKVEVQEPSAELAEPKEKGHDHLWADETTMVNQSVDVISWACQGCKLTFQDQQEAQAHVLTHGAYETSTVTLPLAELWMLQCDDCDFLCDTAEELAQHQQEAGEPAHQTVYTIVGNAVNSVTNYVCSCGQFSSTDAAAAAEHLKGKAGFRTEQITEEATGTKCECGMDFGTDWDALGAHQDSFVGKSDEALHDGNDTYDTMVTLTVTICNGCGNRLDANEDPADHANCGSGEGHQITQGSQMVSGEPIYGWRCQICQLSWTSQTYADKHTENNPGIVPHTGYSYVNANAGKTETVSGFFCKDCSFFSSDEAETKNHVASHYVLTTQTERTQQPVQMETGWQYCTVEGCTARREKTD